MSDGAPDVEPLRVYMRDNLDGRWKNFSVEDWIDTYRERINAVVDLHGRTVGGTLTLTGTAERGRITLLAPGEYGPILDRDWCTLTMSQALSREPSDIPPNPFSPSTMKRP